MGVLVPLVGVLFGYAGIFRKVRSVKLQMRQHRLRQPANAIKAEIAPQDSHDAPPLNNFNQDDIRLAKTLFLAFLVFFVCW
jgi:hypothetical protein